MGWFRSHEDDFRHSLEAKPRPKRVSGRRLGFESLEERRVLTGTATFNLVNNTTIDPAGDLAFTDGQINVAIFCQDYTTGDYYSFDSSGTATQTLSLLPPHATGTVPLPTFSLTSMTKTGDHTYSIDLPLDLNNTGFGMDSARVYVSMNAPLNLTVNPDALGSVNAPTLGSAFIDFFEFSTNSEVAPGDSLDIDTSNVDQFDIPFKITVDSTDSSNPANGVGIAEPRDAVISQFQAFTSSPGNPFAVCVGPSSGTAYGPYQILNPSDVLSTAV